MNAIKNLYCSSLSNMYKAIKKTFVDQATDSNLKWKCINVLYYIRKHYSYFRF